jgi:hypothetical protein
LLSEEPESFSITWSNDHACGNLPGYYKLFDDALAAAEEWKRGMVAMDEDPEGAEEEYSWKIIEWPEDKS